MHGEYPEVPFYRGGVVRQWSNGLTFFDSPGRFFAANELKCLMGHILLNYDIKWPNRDFLEGGYYPPNEPFGIFTGPNENATIMFRRRTQV